jgi:hypothetical protein
MSHEQDNLWFKFLATRYEIDGGRVRRGGWLGSAWLKQLLAMRHWDGLKVGR